MVLLINYAYLILSVFLSVCIAVLVFYITELKPYYIQQRELKQFRKSLCRGMYVRIPGSPLIYKIIAINDSYVQLYHSRHGPSGHPISSIFPVDYDL